MNLSPKQSILVWMSCFSGLFHISKEKVLSIILRFNPIFFFLYLHIIYSLPLLLSFQITKFHNLKSLRWCILGVELHYMIFQQILLNKSIPYDRNYLPISLKKGKRQYTIHPIFHVVNVERTWKEYADVCGSIIYLIYPSQLSIRFT